jgi:hypothetical protein
MKPRKHTQPRPQTANAAAQTVAAAEATLKELQAQVERHTGRATELEAARKQVSARMPCMMPSSVKSVD